MGQFLRIGFLLAFLVSGQSSLIGQSKITGSIKDKITLAPIPLVNITIKNTELGTTTNESGAFLIVVPDSQSLVLLISHVNYMTQELEIQPDTFHSPLHLLLTPKEAISLDEVIISSENLDRLPLKNLTKGVELVSKNDIKSEMNSSIADVLNNVNGVSRVWEYHSPIILRGLSSDRLLIMKNSNRRISTLPGGYFGQDLNIYNARKIEVIKGPGSVIYGNGAISGIINIISPYPFGDKNSIDFTTGYGSNNNEFLKVFNVAYGKEKYGINLNGRFRTTDDMKYGGGETALNSDVEDRDIAINMGYKISNQQDLLVNIDYHFGDWGKPRGFNGPDKRFTKIRVKEENFHANLIYRYEFDGFIDFLELNTFFDSGWSNFFQNRFSLVTEELTSRDIVHYTHDYGGGRLFSRLNITKNDKLTLGFDTYRFRMDSPTELIDFYNNTTGEIFGNQGAGQDNLGVFTNNEWQINEKLFWVTGVRFDWARVLEGKTQLNLDREEKRNAFSGNTGISYGVSPNTSVSFNIGKSFRMPTNNEMFTTVVNSQGVRAGNPDLKPENGWNFDAGFRGNTKDFIFRYDVSLFYNKIDDFITGTASEEEGVDLTFRNADAQLLGGEVSMKYRFKNVLKTNNDLVFYYNTSYVYANDISQSKNQPLFGIPPLEVKSGFNYLGFSEFKWIDRYSFGIDVNYAATQNRIPPIPNGTDGGSWGYIPSKENIQFDVVSSLDLSSIPGSPKLNLFINNIFDVEYNPWGSFVPAMGRNLRLLMTLNF